MLKDVVAVEPLADYRLCLRFDDGAEGVISLTELIPFEGVFEPLRDPAFFRQVRIHPELGSIEWPNGADLDSDVLYAVATGVPLPEFFHDAKAS